MTCRVEGPDVAQLAQDYPDLNIVGLGSQDTIEFANEFVTATGTGGGDISMVWDASFDSWREFGVRSQPYWILYDDAGNLVTSRPGAVDINAVIDVVN